MHALRQAHDALVPSGALVDMRPGFASSPVLSGDRELGRLDETAFIDEMSRAEPALAEAVSARLFAVEVERFFDLVHRFGSSAHLVEEVGTWRGTSIPLDVRASLEAAEPPLDVLERCVLRRLRAL